MNLSFLSVHSHFSKGLFSLLTFIAFFFGTYVPIEELPNNYKKIYTQPVSAKQIYRQVTLYRRGEESYQTLLRRAEAIARALAQRSFEEDILTTQVVIIISGKHDGSIVPILRLKVTRTAWQQTPETHQWATYFPLSEKLLGF